MKMKNLSKFQVFVEDANGKSIDDAEVELNIFREKEIYKLTHSKVPGMLIKDDLNPGIYMIKVTSAREDFQPESRKIKLISGHNTLTFVLGMENQPFYYNNEMKIYFQPDENSFLVTTRGNNANNLTKQFLKSRNLESSTISLKKPLTDAEKEIIPQQPSDICYITINMPKNQPISQTNELMSSIERELKKKGLKVILALPIRRGDRPVMGLTNELIVKFKDNVGQGDVEQIAKKLELTVNRLILSSKNTYILSLLEPPSYNLLNIANILVEKYPVISAEPNLLAPLESDQYTPNDHLWANLTHLPLINCNDAWQTINNINSIIRGGDPSICIAVLDLEGVAPDHPDLTANLSDGVSKLLLSFDFVNMNTQTVGNLVGDHGTMCAGSTIANFDNNIGIAGVAPNCRLIGVRLPNPIRDSDVVDIFMWAAGFNSGNPDPNFPALPTQPADIISNSWGRRNVALRTAVRDCFDLLTDEGRQGRGCIITFSIGNLGYVQFSNIRTYAAYERTLAVGASINVNPTTPVNSFHRDPNGITNNINVAVDTRALYSPYGPELDIVAPSHTTYNPVGALIDQITSTVRVGTGALDGCPAATVCMDYDQIFGGTSHSSPTIAGVAALILTIDPNLSWRDVKEILHTTAVRIDNNNTDPIGQWVDNDNDGINEFSQWYGYGRVDINAAVNESLNYGKNTFIVAWEDDNNKNGIYQIYARSFSPDGRERFGDMTVNSIASGQQFKPTIAMAENGDFVVVWEDDSNKNGKYQIYARGFFTNGTERFADMTVNSVGSGQQLKPAIAMADNGNFVVVWEDDRDMNGKYQIYARGFYANGTELFADMTVNSVATGQQLKPAIAMAPYGDFVVVWEDDKDRNGKYQIYARGFYANGSEHFGDMTVNSVASGQQLKPAIAMAEDGNFVVVWEDDKDENGKYQIYARGFYANGSEHFGDITVNSVATGQQLKPAIAMAENGDFVVVWEDDSNKNNIYQIYARGFYANGSEHFGDITVNSVATGQQLKPVVAMGRKVILSHCFISTVTGGTSLEKDVQLLRTFRDQVLRNTKSGKLLFDKFYNKYNNISSMIVKEMNKDPQVRGIVKWAIVNPIVNYLKLVQSFPDSPINNLEEPWQSFLKKTQDDLEGWAKNCLNFAASQIEFDINKYLNKFTPENLVTEINLALTYIYRNEQARIDWLKQLGELNLIPLSIDKEEKTKIIEKLKILGRSESEIIQILGK